MRESQWRLADPIKLLSVWCDTAGLTMRFWPGTVGMIANDSVTRSAWVWPG